MQIFAKCHVWVTNGGLFLGVSFWGSRFGGLVFSPLSLFLCFCFPFLCVARGIGGLPLRRRCIPVLPFFPAPHPLLFWLFTSIVSMC